MICLVSGARLHRVCSAQRHAFGVWQGRQEEGPDQELGQPVRTNPERAPDLAGRLPRHRQTEGAAPTSRLHQVQTLGQAPVRQGETAYFTFFRLVVAILITMQMLGV